MVTQNNQYSINVRSAKWWVYEESMKNYFDFIPLVLIKDMWIDK